MASKPKQKSITGRVMHRVQNGRAQEGRNGKGAKVSVSPGRSAYSTRGRPAPYRYERGPATGAIFVARKRKEDKDRTGQQNGGQVHVGANRKLRVPARWQVETPPTQKLGARTETVHRAPRKPDGHTRQELYARAQRRQIEGRIQVMRKEALENEIGSVNSLELGIQVDEGDSDIRPLPRAWPA